MNFFSLILNFISELHSDPIFASSSTRENNGLGNQTAHCRSSVQQPVNGKFFRVQVLVILKYCNVSKMLQFYLL